ncbi:Rab GDP dissociation inhibitor alpha [Ascosphaera acerosa]|nr:Rab GDP dissociation inhibitor alpha [Ascosphaera acerosa]
MADIAPEYDVVVLGTGLTECVLSGVLSVKGKKVLHIDRNGYYGGEAASVNIETLFRRFKPSSIPGNVSSATPPPWAQYGRPQDWNIDLVPKLLMSNGELTNILVSTDVTRYLDFRQIAGSYVQQGSGADATVARVPSDAREALSSSLMGVAEKTRAKAFLDWVGKFDEAVPETAHGIDIASATMREIYDKFGLEESTRDFIGHAMALYPTDAYLTQPGAGRETVARLRLYVNSMARYGKSPYIYPLYGLGELPQGFARLAAIHGGTYMLNTAVEEVVYDAASGRVAGIKAAMSDEGGAGADADGQPLRFQTKCRAIIADPSYFPDKVRVAGHVLRAICILTHPVEKAEESDSLQLVIPQSQVGRKSDIYIAVVGHAHHVCPAGYYVAIVSTVAESADADWHTELAAGFERLGAIEETFVGAPVPVYEPVADGRADGVFVSRSYDATSHFESTTDDVKDIYERCEGHELVVEGLREHNLVGAKRGE